MCGTVTSNTTSYNACLDSVDHLWSAMVAVCTPTPEMDGWTTRGTSIEKLRLYLTKLSIRPEANVDPSVSLKVGERSPAVSDADVVTLRQRFQTQEKLEILSGWRLRNRVNIPDTWCFQKTGNCQPDLPKPGDEMLLAPSVQRDAALEGLRRSLNNMTETQSQEGAPTNV